MAVTQADIDALNSAIASGERVVVLNGESVTYRSIPELITARNDLQQQLDAALPVKRNKRIYNYYAGRGYK